jgi:hypothetical protein
LQLFEKSFDISDRGHFLERGHVLHFGVYHFLARDVCTTLLSGGRPWETLPFIAAGIFFLFIKVKLSATGAIACDLLASLHRLLECCFHFGALFSRSPLSW